MIPSASGQEVAALERSIETKRRLLAYLRSKPQHLTMESFLCLTRILTRAGWRQEDAHWHRGDLHLPTLAAADAELEHQVHTETDRLLRQTVAGYRSMKV